MGHQRLTGEMARIGGFLREIYALQDMPALHQTIAGGLGALVAGDNIFIGEHDMENTLITGCAARHLFETPDFLPIVNSCVGEHPLWEAIRTGGQTTRCISDHAPAGKWENSTLYREALGKEGVRDHLSVEFGKRTRRLVSVGVFRSSRGFSSRDHETMRFLLPHLGQALDNARIVGESGLAEGCADLIGFISLDEDGLHRDLPHPVRLTIGEFFDERRQPANRLPQAIGSWIASARALMNRGALERIVRPLRVRAGSRTLELRILRQRLEPGYLVTVRSQNDAPPAIRLTPREADVLHWLREGKRNEEIGIILGMAITTVKTHLKHIYQKLGVETRTAACRADLPAAGLLKSDISPHPTS